MKLSRYIAIELDAGMLPTLRFSTVCLEAGLPAEVISLQKALIAFLISGCWSPAGLDHVKLHL